MRVLPESSLSHSHILLPSTPLPFRITRLSSFVLSAFDMATAIKNFIPLFDRILVSRAVAATKTKGGIMLPESSQKKLNEAVVVACGPGGVDADGDVIPVSVAVGDKVLLPEYGGTKLTLDDEDFLLIRDSEILGKFVKVTES
eukprot:sb/3474084/